MRGGHTLAANRARDALIVVAAGAVGATWGAVTQELAVRGSTWRDLANVAAAWWLLAVGFAALAATRRAACACGVAADLAAVFVFYLVQRAHFGAPLLRAEVLVWLAVAVASGLVAGMLAFAARRRRLAAAAIAVPFLCEPVFLYLRESHTLVRTSIGAAEVILGLTMLAVLALRAGLHTARPVTRHGGAR